MDLSYITELANEVIENPTVQECAKGAGYALIFSVEILTITGLAKLLGEPETRQKLKGYLTNLLSDSKE